MGKKDVETKSYMAVNERFADLFNFFLYDGEEVIQPENLEERDPAELFLSADSGKVTKKKQKERDLLKSLIVREAEGICYVLLGLENQSYVDYGMPVRNMVYESLRYAGQVRDFARMHEANRKEGREHPAASEYLSGLGKEDKLLPVITLTLYWGREDWDAPVTLHEMLDIPDKRLLPYIADYKLNLVLPQEIKDFGAFKTELRQVLEAIKASHSKQEIKQLIEGDESYKKLGKDTMMMIKHYAGIEIEVEEMEEKVNLCQGLIDLKAEERAEGRAEAQRDIIRNMHEQGLDNELIASCVKLTVDEVREILK